MHFERTLRRNPLGIIDSIAESKKSDVFFWEIEEALVQEARLFELQL